MSSTAFKGSIDVKKAAEILLEEGLLREVAHNGFWTRDPQKAPEKVFSKITYDSRQAGNDTLLFCKGNFSPEYLKSAKNAGCSAYVSETDFPEITGMTGIIVNDVRKAMAVLAAFFYDYPQKSLKIAGITGTKGKTTTAYFTHAILNAASGGKAALFSSSDNCIDGHTYVESELTTPESLDLFSLMREAVENGMEYAVVEVSSQAYKVNRVYGLTFDAGAFLNISPDHISDIEHPTFEDYFYCKTQIAQNSRVLIRGIDLLHSNIVDECAKMRSIDVKTFAVRAENDPEEETSTKAASQNSKNADIQAVYSKAGNPVFKIIDGGKNSENPQPGEIKLSTEGTFNGANLAAAIAVAKTLGINDFSAWRAAQNVTVPGRMEYFSSPDGIEAYADYAHNYISVKNLIDYVIKKYEESESQDKKIRITVVTGSVGNKAVDRRKEIIQAAQENAHRIILTSEDTNDEPFEKISREMISYLTNESVKVSVVEDRREAVETAYREAVENSDFHNVLLVIGKGSEKWIKKMGKHVPYEGDDAIIRRLFGLD